MDPARELGRWLLGGAPARSPLLGALPFVGARLPLRLGRLPGDIAIQGRRGSFYFPIVTCLLLSVAPHAAVLADCWLRGCGE